MSTIDKEYLVFGKYACIRRLAVGGMGEIFLAQQHDDIGIDRLVIIKSLLPELARDPNFTQQFLDEARVASHLNHPNIVSIYDVGLWRSLYFIAMEYIQGITLAQLMRNIIGNQQRVPYSLSAKVVMDACIALGHVRDATDSQGQALNIVHRDISPQNIMIRQDGVTKLLDFGIAKADNKQHHTQTGLLKGKYCYMSPEQALGKKIDWRTDQFALGIVLWELLTHERYVSATLGQEAILKRITQSEIPSACELRPDIPSALDDIIGQMCQRDPEKRFSSWDEILEAFEQYRSSSENRMEDRHVATYLNANIASDIADQTLDRTPRAREILATILPVHELSNPIIDPKAPGPRSNESGDDVTEQDLEEEELTGIQPPLPQREEAEIFEEINALGRMPTAKIPKPNRASHHRHHHDGVHPQKPSKLPWVVATLALLILLASLAIQIPTVKDTLPPTVLGPIQKIHEVYVNQIQPLFSGAKNKTAPNTNQLTSIEIPIPAGATVFVDTIKWKELVPTTITGLKPGRHKIRLELPGHDPIVRIMELLPNQPIQLREEAKPIGADLVLRSIPKGARVFKGSRILGITPVSIGNLPSGVEHLFTLTHKGFATQKLAITLAPKEKATRVITLAKTNRKTKTKNATNKNKSPNISQALAPAPPSPLKKSVESKEPGFLTLKTEPWVQVEIDGEKVGVTPLWKHPLKPGAHTLRLYNEEAGVNTTRKIQIGSDKITKLKWKLE